MLSYLALGDSYTIGEGVAASGRWPVQLAELLRAEGIAIADPHILAQTGWTTDELDAAIDDAEPSFDEYDLVSLLIGVNNQYRGREIGEYRRQFAALLERAIGFAGGRANRAVVLSIPDWSVTPFAAQQSRDAKRVGGQIDAFNAAAKAICEAAGAAFVDITPIGRERAGEPAMLADDGLHPSAAMYAAWAKLALPAARAALQLPPLRKGD